MALARVISGFEDNLNLKRGVSDCFCEQSYHHEHMIVSSVRLSVRVFIKGEVPEDRVGVECLNEHMFTVSGQDIGMSNARVTFQHRLMLCCQDLNPPKQFPHACHNLSGHRRAGIPYKAMHFLCLSVASHYLTPLTLYCMPSVHTRVLSLSHLYRV